MRKTKENCIYWFALVVGCVGLWLVVSRIAHFKMPDYFYLANPNITTCVGNNVVCAFADFSYFTYITIILFSVWCILFFFAKIFKNNKLYIFLTRDWLLSFIFVNYIFTTILYTGFEIAGECNFGLYANVPYAWHCFGTNIIAHYVLFVCACVLFLRVRANISNSKLPSIFISMFLLIYYVSTKLAGEFAYAIRWFPYVIFDAKTFGNLFGITNHSFSVVLLIFVCSIIFAIYLSVYKLIVLIAQKRSRNYFAREIYNKTNSQ